MNAPTRKEKIEQMLAEDPQDSFLRYGLAMELVSAGQDDQAIDQLRELLRRDPEYVPAYLQAGQAFLRLGEEEQAKQILREGIDMARKVNDGHAASEMSGLLQGLG
ncbi:MAG: tetratricopeptide repeat protein [Gemmataceae bacterium]